MVLLLPQNKLVVVFTCLMVLPLLLVTQSVVAESDSSGTVTNNIETDDHGTAHRSSKKPLVDCSSDYSTSCLRMDIASWVEKIDQQQSYSLLPGLVVVRENITESTSDMVAEIGREFPNDPNARISAFMMKKLTGFLRSHTVRLNLGDAAVATARAVGTARGKNKGGGGGGGLLYLAAMMKAMFMALALAALAALAGKALMAALASLLLSAVVGLKGMGGGKSHTTYEVIAKPVISHSNTHSEEHASGGYGHHSYGRSFGGLPLGLQPGYQPGQ